MHQFLAYYGLYVDIQFIKYIYAKSRLTSSESQGQEEAALHAQPT